MPLPLLGAIPIIGSVVAGVSTASTIVATYIVGKLSLKSFILGAQISATLLVFTLHIGIATFYYYIIAFFFNQYNALLASLNSMSEESDLLSISMNILQSIGFINAFNDVFSIFSIPLVAYLIHKGSAVLFHTAKATSDELFKIGVLTQQ